MEASGVMNAGVASGVTDVGVEMDVRTAEARPSENGGGPLRGGGETRPTPYRRQPRGDDDDQFKKLVSLQTKHMTDLKIHRT